MIEFIFEILLSILIGGIAGTIYFGGLWLTLQRINKKSPYLLVLFSFFLRLALAVGCFYLAFLAGGIWGILAALLAFIAVKLIAIRKVKIIKT
jgi:F1F0 ATPase subunit 2